MNGGNILHPNPALNSSSDDSKRRKKDEQGLLAFGGDPSEFDQDLYGKGESGQFSKYAGGFDDDEGRDRVQKKIKSGYSATKELIEEAKLAGSHEDIMDQSSRRISDREDKYLQRKNRRMLSPPRHDPFQNVDKTPDVNSRNYAGIMMDQKLENERHDVLIKVAKAQEEEKKRAKDNKEKARASRDDKTVSKDRKAPSVSTAGSSASEWEGPTKPGASKWDAGARGEESISRKNRWDLTPVGTREEATPGRNRFGETPTPGGRWGAEPTPGRFGETPTPGRAGKSRWDDKTPVVSGGVTPSTYGGYTPTPVSVLKEMIVNRFLGRLIGNRNPKHEPAELSSSIDTGESTAA